MKKIDKCIFDDRKIRIKNASQTLRSLNYR